MNRNSIHNRSGLAGTTVLALLGILALDPLSQAQPFAYQNNDLCLGFRKNAPYTENYEVVVNIGQAGDYINAAVGTTKPVQGFTASQLTPGSFTTLNNLSWSVTGFYSGNGLGAAYPASAQFTLWVTVPRTSIAARSKEPSRFEWTLQRNARLKIVSILSNAGFVSHDLATANQFNTTTFVRESISVYPQHLLSIWMGGLNDNSIGTLNDTWPPGQPNGGNLENATPDSFTAVSRSDLYEVRPLTDGQLNPVADPNTGTTGMAHYLGYFELKPDGSMTFTREAASVPTTPPPAPKLSISREANVSVISFASAPNATYTLLYNSADAITAPASAWSSLPNKITGDGTTREFKDTSATTDRVYRVEAR